MAQPTPAASTHGDGRISADIGLVAIDVDGTLLRTDKQISRRCATAVAGATASGIRVVLASARPPRSLRELRDRLRLDTLQINYNGALIHDPMRNRHIYHQPMDPILVRRIVKTARYIDPDVVVSVEILDKWYTDHFSNDLGDFPVETSRRFAPDFVGPLDAFLNVPVTKLMLLGPPPRLAAVRAMIRKRFASRIALPVSDTFLVQVAHPQVDKGDALRRVAGIYDVPQDRVMAIGDAPNDVGMLKWAGLGVAMANGWEEARSVADAITPSNDEDGVAVALSRWVLREKR